MAERLSDYRDVIRKALWRLFPGRNDEIAAAVLNRNQRTAVVIIVNGKLVCIE